jgi:hypothetical protein
MTSAGGGGWSIGCAVRGWTSWHPTSVGTGTDRSGRIGRWWTSRSTGAGHMGPLTHRDAVNDAIVSHIETAVARTDA